MQFKEELNVPEAKLPRFRDKYGDFRDSFPWRTMRIFSEFVDGFTFLAEFNDIKTVTFFGSARFRETDKWYGVARELGALLGKKGYGVVTGGGPGIMEAGNRGAQESGGESIGLNIQLPFEQRTNPYVKKGIGFHYFFSRKTMLTYAAQAYVFFPGGYGTLDEFFEWITIIQTKKRQSCIPIICVGREFWEPLVEFMRKTLLEKFEAISKEDLDLFVVVDTAEEAWKVIKKSPHIKYF